MYVAVLQLSSYYSTITVLLLYYSMNCCRAAGYSNRSNDDSESCYRELYWFLQQPELKTAASVGCTNGLSSSPNDNKCFHTKFVDT